MVLDLDLNAPPAEGTSSPINHQVSSAESGKGLFNSPIDVEELDDEVELLPSSAGFPQRRQRRRNRGTILDLDQVMEIPLGQSGISVDEPAAILLSLRSHSNYEGTSTHRNAIYHQFFDLEQIDNTEMHNGFQPKLLPWQWHRRNEMASSHIEPQRMAASLPQPPPLAKEKEPTFICPLCMDSLTNPCSTFCGHIFCQSCIEAAIAASVKRKAGKQCPTCRAKLPARKNFHRVYLPSAD